MHTSFSDNEVLGRYVGDKEPHQDDLQQLLAASALICKLERVCSMGVLSVEDEIDAREIIVRAANAFKFDTLAERPLPASNIIDLDSATEELVRREMARVL